MDKQYFWQKTERCAQCAFNDDPNACHWYGYRFWDNLPMADDCWDFLTPEQWNTVLSMYGRYKLKDVHTKFREFSRKNHPDLPPDYRPSYYPDNDPLTKEDELFTW